ncbi:hypothetical protein KC19_12G125500 [Ceratodon purpureus]|uniref:Solute carrier family 40 member n=1 Tax=Ceratodon purpureus TaxID=3225 RepID=A0A8T0G6H2_CERPU|nr:hypothetical protein KC19_12G125500 [Ceratodon purpureus]
MEIQFSRSAAMAEITAESDAFLPERQLDCGGTEEELKAGSVGDGVAGFGEKVQVLSDEEKLSHLVRCLYWSHFLSRWGDRMWEFAVGLFMLQVWPDSLLLVAIYGLVETASVATLGVVVGELVDKWPRLRMVQLSLGIQNGSVAAAALGIVLLLLHPGTAPGGFGTFVMLVVIVNAFGATSALSGMAMDIVVERDWVVLIAEKQGEGFLTQINAAMRRIDLSCKLLAPVAVGFMMSSVSMLSSAVLIAIWNVTSVWVEYWLLHHVYMAVPTLQQKSIVDPASKSSRSRSLDESSTPGEVELGILASGNIVQVEDNEEVRLLGGRVTPSRPQQSGIVEKLKHLPLVEGWATYMHQEAMLAGLALALLYFTVLSFGSFMTAVLNWRGIPAYALALARGVAALFGILATVIYPVVHARLHTVRTGIWSIWIQCSLLSLCVVSIWIHNSRLASILLISGVAASRLGLWMFDLSVTQLMQESVPEAERGVVGGVQKSLQSLMDMLTYVVGMVIVHPQDFGITICMSYGAVMGAALLYSMHVYRVRGHLFHFDRFIRSSWYSR